MNKWGTAMRSKSSSQKGASLVEFALVLPLLMLILWGMIEFGLLLYNKQVITNASREGARAGIVAQAPRVSNGQIVGVVNSYCASYLISFGGAGLNVTTDPATPVTASFGDPLTVTVTYPYQFLVFQNIANTFFGGSFGTITLTAVTVMRYE
jgi:Flp pilus assembly protein TadG